MKSIRLKTLGVGIFAFAALAVSGFTALSTGASAGASGFYEGPHYSTYAACNADRVRFQSSFTRAGSCFRAQGYNPTTHSYVDLGYYTFYVSYR